MYMNFFLLEDVYEILVKNIGPYTFLTWHHSWRACGGLAFNHTSYLAWTKDWGSTKSDQSNENDQLMVACQEKEKREAGHDTPSGRAGQIRRAIPHKNKKLNNFIRLFDLPCKRTWHGKGHILTTRNNRRRIRITYNFHISSSFFPPSCPPSSYLYRTQKICVMVYRCTTLRFTYEDDGWLKIFQLQATFTINVIQIQKSIGKSETKTSTYNKDPEAWRSAP